MNSLRSTFATCVKYSSWMSRSPSTLSRMKFAQPAANG